MVQLDVGSADALVDCEQDPIGERNCHRHRHSQCANVGCADADAKQVVAAKTAFEELRERRFLPFDQIDEDPARAELDRRLLVDVLGLPESLVASDGPLDLLRRKLAREPQIHGGKKTRVVFYDEGER